MERTSFFDKVQVSLQKTSTFPQNHRRKPEISLHGIDFAPDAYLAKKHAVDVPRQAVPRSSCAFFAAETASNPSNQRQPHRNSSWSSRSTALCGESHGPARRIPLDRTANDRPAFLPRWAPTSSHVCRSADRIAKPPYAAAFFLFAPRVTSRAKMFEWVGQGCRKRFRHRRRPSSFARTIARRSWMRPACFTQKSVNLDVTHEPLWIGRCAGARGVMGLLIGIPDSTPWFSSLVFTGCSVGLRRVRAMLRPPSRRPEAR